MEYTSDLFPLPLIPGLMTTIVPIHRQTKIADLTQTLSLTPPTRTSALANRSHWKAGAQVPVLVKAQTIENWSPIALDTHRQTNCYDRPKARLLVPPESHVLLTATQDRKS